MWRVLAQFGAIWRGWSLRVEALCLPCLHESEDRLREKARDKEWLHVAKPAHLKIMGRMSFESHRPILPTRTIL